MRFEPGLHIDVETAGLIENTFMPLLESPTVIVTDAYPFPLAAEIVGDAVHVRAATGDELTAFLTVGDAPKGFRYILSGMNAERILIGAECIGDAKWFIEKATEYAKDRVVFGRPIGQNQGCSFPSRRPMRRCGRPS